MVRIDQLNDLKWTAEDLDKRYRHSYLAASVQQPDGTFKKDVVYIGNIHDDAVTYQTKQGPLAEVSIKKFFVEEDRADPCISNFGLDSAFFYCWNPARQWRRGWCTDNSYVYQGPLISPSPVIDFLYAGLIYKPQHMHIDAAMEQFKSEASTKARALNNMYWLLRKNKEAQVQLYRRRCFMGSFIGKKFFISSDAKIFNDEIEKELPILGKKYA